MMVALENGVLCNGVLNTQPLENEHCPVSLGGPAPKYKRRKVSAVRDFPPRCGPSSAQINLAQINAEPIPAKLPKSIENEVFNVSEESNENGAGEVMELQESVDGAVLVNAEKVSGEVVEAPELADGAVSVSALKLCLQPQEPKNDNTFSEWASPKGKFQRRRVSAIRDFPPFCGMNAPPPSKEERLKVQSGNKSLGGMMKADTDHVQMGKNSMDSLHTRAREEKSSAGLERVTVKDRVMECADVSQGAAQDENSEKNESKAIVPVPVNDIRKSVMDELVDVPISTFGESDMKATVPAPVRELNAVVKLRKEEVAGFTGEVKKEIVVYSPRKSNAVAESSKENEVGPKAEVKKEIVVYSPNNCVKRKPPISTSSSNCETEREVVQGLAAAPNCPWRQERGAKIGSVRASMEKKIKKADLTGKLKSKLFTKSDCSGRNFSMEKSLYTRKAARKDDCVADSGQQYQDSPAGRTLCDVDVVLPPFGPNSSSDARNRVRETLRLYQAICRKILQGEEARSKQGEESTSGPSGKLKRIDLEAANIIKQKSKEVNTGKQIIGAVPGVEVGDEFQYRVELAIIGVHRLYQAGIDYIKHGKDVIATSIVASGAYADDLENAEKLIYSGQGGNIVGKDKRPVDQKLVRGNLALKNSISVKNPVRVIRGTKEMKASSDSSDARGKIVTTYVYDGLYTVENYWPETGPLGQLVYMFELKRMPGQPELAWKEVKKSKKYQMREGLCVKDISGGKEVIPIGAVNMLDDEKPPEFNYITKMIYPEQHHSVLSKGCDCTGRCSSSKCSCAVKNGGEIPYNHNGAIVEAKTLVYECGPHCKCAPSCYNRVSQHGIKIQLEIFKTESRGWGVRSLSFIPSGSFICEYIGELLEDTEAEKRTGNDEYLFDIGQNYSDCSSKPDAESGLMEVVEDGGYTIDAAHYGNVGRFINHSCSPNLYAQNVLYDHEDKRMPHIMLFAAENIPPLQELSYHYNYTIDQVYDSNGNVKMKSCYCGSAECTGRMY